MPTFNNALEIPVIYNGQEFSFPAKFVLSGYTHKIQVEVDGQVIGFEPDEERNYRAMLDPAQLEKGWKVDIGLLQAIAGVIESVVK
jgi:hypothetical protein